MDKYMKLASTGTFESVPFSNINPGDIVIYDGVNEIIENEEYGLRRLDYIKVKSLDQEGTKGEFLYRLFGNDSFCVYRGDVKDLEFLSEVKEGTTCKAFNTFDKTTVTFRYVGYLEELEYQVEVLDGSLSSGNEFEDEDGNIWGIYPGDLVVEVESDPEEYMKLAAEDTFIKFAPLKVGDYIISGSPVYKVLEMNSIDGCLCEIVKHLIPENIGKKVFNIFGPDILTYRGDFNRLKYIEELGVGRSLSYFSYLKRKNMKVTIVEEKDNVFVVRNIDGSTISVRKGTVVLIEEEYMKLSLDKEASKGSIAILSNGEGKVLQVLRSDSRKWSFPGGHAELGETPLDTVKRELREELRANISNWKFVADIGDTSVYSGSIVSDISLNDENLDYRFFDIDNFPVNQYKPVDEIVDAYKKLSLFKLSNLMHHFKKVKAEELKEGDIYVYPFHVCKVVELEIDREILKIYVTFDLLKGEVDDNILLDYFYVSESVWVYTGDLNNLACVKDLNPGEKFVYPYSIDTIYTLDRLPNDNKFYGLCITEGEEEENKVEVFDGLNIVERLQKPLEEYMKLAGRVNNREIEMYFINDLGERLTGRFYVTANSQGQYQARADLFCRPEQEPGLRLHSELSTDNSTLNNWILLGVQEAVKKGWIVTSDSGPGREPNEYMKFSSEEDLVTRVKCSTLKVGDIIIDNYALFEVVNVGSVIDDKIDLEFKVIRSDFEGYLGQILPVNNSKDRNFHVYKGDLDRVVYAKELEVGNKFACPFNLDKIGKVERQLLTECEYILENTGEVFLLQNKFLVIKKDDEYMKLATESNWKSLEVRDLKVGDILVIESGASVIENISIFSTDAIIRRRYLKSWVPGLVGESDDLEPKLSKKFKVYTGNLDNLVTFQEIDTGSQFVIGKNRYIKLSEYTAKESKSGKEIGFFFSELVEKIPEEYMKQAFYPNILNPIFKIANIKPVSDLNENDVILHLDKKWKIAKIRGTVWHPTEGFYQNSDLYLKSDLGEYLIIFNAEFDREFEVVDEYMKQS